MPYKYLKGPVHSRRLGKSLGINLIPNNICSFDCVYCEVGLTDKLTIKRKEYVSTTKIIKELDDYLQKDPELDYLTFSSRGEPTLHTGIEDIINHIKKHYPQFKIALLTNSSLFTTKKVIKQVQNIDLIVPSLDAVHNDIFEKINRPHPNLDINNIIDGLVNLREEYDGKIWLEIFIIPELNDNQREIEGFIEAIKNIKPDLVQLNSLDRPAPEDWVKTVSKSNLEKIVEDIKNGINNNTTVIAV